jgi:antitoxin HicB
MRYAYPAAVLEEPDGVTVSFPDVPGAITCGDTREEALERGQDALISVLSVYVEENRPLPRPSPARGRPLIPVAALDAAKLALHDAMLAAHMSNVELGRRLGLDEKQVRRLRDPLHQSHIGKVEAALRILGKRLEVEVKEAA